MKQVYQIDSNGFYQCPVILDDDTPLAPNQVETIFPEGMYKPQWVNGAWVESEDPATILINVKSSKIAELNYQFQLTMANGFTSSADGTSRTFPLDQNSMLKWTGAMSVVDSNVVTNPLIIKDINGNQVTVTHSFNRQL